ncbi:K(+) efflux antiporter 1, chloroplastic-like [Carica papaya]|uniref:K(+) efflux antiporter 1, chloroplastic-like n=1 Tax=Carica papaya TaxID=3649 RepID=UPI000B8CBE4B|nr:K(+) efflux antiporter 1, chloroplastic-like [Carica papaya]
MDFACSIQQPNLFHGCEGTRYRSLNRFLGSRFSYNGFDPTIGWKTWSGKRLRKNVTYSGRLSSSLVLKGRRDGHLRVLYSKRSLSSSLGDIIKVSRGVKSCCQGNDSFPFIDGNGRNVEFLGSNDEAKMESIDGESNGSAEGEKKEKEDIEALSVDELRELLQKAMKELEVARVNSSMFEEKAQKISEAAIALKDEAEDAWNDVNSTLDMIQEIVNEECAAKEAVQKATMALSLAEARLQVAIESMDAAGLGEGVVVEDEVDPGNTGHVSTEREIDALINADSVVIDPCPDIVSEGAIQSSEKLNQPDDLSDHENGKLSVDSSLEAEAESEKSKNIIQTKKQEAQKDLIRENSSLNSPKALLKKSSRFFSASFFSFTVEGSEFTPASGQSTCATPLSQ